MFVSLNKYSHKFRKMKILVEGHRYEAANFEKEYDPGQQIQFIHKVKRSEHPGMSPEGSDPDELITLSDGTTNEELLSVLIDRMQYLQSQFPCRENAIAITKLEESLMWLEKRTSDRVKRNVEGKNKA